MNYLRAENISRHFGDRVLFENLTLTIESGEHKALIARNGAGKTNLLQMLAGKEEPDSGSIIISKDISVGYLEQEPAMPAGMTVWDALFNSHNELLNAVARYEKILEQTHHDHSPEMMGQLQQAMDQMDQLQAWDYEVRIRQILSKLNIHHYEQDVASLSGGQKKRLALARLLILAPDLLILDEPTNHLDLTMIEWLEGYLKSGNMALLVVTHDRYFLDAVCTEILELDNGKLYTHRGNYAYFLEKKADRIFREKREVEKANNLMRKELEWMRRQPKARGTKSKSRIESFYDLKEKAGIRIQEDKVALDIKMQRLGGKIVEFNNVNKSFKRGEASFSVLSDFSYLFKPGERIGIVGDNGVGKTTFLNLLTGQEQPDSGRISLGDTIVCGYYAQTGMKLEDDRRVIDVVRDVAEYIEMSKGEKITAEQLCRRFLFDDKMQHTFVSKLSGGEKRRLYLLTILMRNPNFLILDEPTNDLDIDTLNVLEEFLEQYKGCLILVTHDRYFMDKLTDHLFVFEGQGKVKDFNGNYQDFLEEKTTNTAANKPEKQVKPKETQEPSKQVRKKLGFNEQREYQQLASELQQLTDEKSALEKELNKTDLHYEAISSAASRLEEVKSQINEKELRWLELDELN